MKTIPNSLQTIHDATVVDFEAFIHPDFTQEVDDETWLDENAIALADHAYLNQRDWDAELIDHVFLQGRKWICKEAKILEVAEAINLANEKMSKQARTRLISFAEHLYHAVRTS